MIWQTDSEINVRYFILEKSINGVDFEEIKKVKATGNKNSNASYEYMDYETNPGIYYYRVVEESYNCKRYNVSDVIQLERIAY